MLLSHKLLALDGSAHLQTYHRSLGPQRALRCGPETPRIEARETQVQTHAESNADSFVLLPKDSPQPQINPTPTPTPAQPQPTYPPALASALATAHTHTDSSSSASFQVMKYAESASKVTLCNTIGRYASRAEANDAAVEYFFSRGYWGDGENAEAVVMHGGMMCCSVNGEEGQRVVYVRRG
jgi:hypothetical protein